jgi:sulfur-carrier protein adenylyltransferase/sulfurtransferase
VDVRTPQEYENGHIPGAVLLPLSELEARMAELPATGEILFYCRSGKRSMAASLLAHDSGRFSGATIVNVEGGFSGIRGRGLTGQPRLMALPPDITFRDALLWAMNMEKGAERVYQVLAAEASPLGKAFSRLASLERAHARTVFEMLVQKSPGFLRSIRSTTVWTAGGAGTATSASAPLCSPWQKRRRTTCALWPGFSATVHDFVRCAL